VFCEARRIWSHLLLLGLWERLPNLVPPLCPRAGPLQAIYGATMQPCRLVRLRRGRAPGPPVSYDSPRAPHCGPTGFSATCKSGSTPGYSLFCEVRCGGTSEFGYGPTSLRPSQSFPLSTEERCVKETAHCRPSRRLGGRDGQRRWERWQKRATFAENALGSEIT